MQQEPTPNAGDVIFVYKPALTACLNCLVQSRINSDLGTPVSRWFSHVAIVLNEQVAFEATPTPSPKHNNDSWSGAPHVVEGKEIAPNKKMMLNEGARLVLLPDLLYGATRRAVLRCPSSSPIPPNDFDLTAEHIGLMYGSQYSLSALRQSFEASLPVIAKSMSKPVVELIDQIASSAADEFAKLLQDNNYFSSEIQRVLGTNPIRQFFCSQLVVAMLLHAKLIQNKPGLKNITPFGLFELLVTNGWQDVSDTDYSDDAIQNWLQGDKTVWEIRYLTAVGTISHFRMVHLNKAATTAAQMAFAAATNHLDQIIDRLT
jgi:hypothetical protein